MLIPASACLCLLLQSHLWLSRSLTASEGYSGGLPCVPAPYSVMMHQASQHHTCCSHAALFVESWGIGNTATREQASMSCEPSPGHSLLISLFEVPADPAALEVGPCLLHLAQHSVLHNWHWRLWVHLAVQWSLVRQ